MKKRLTSIILATAMTASFIPASFADNDTEASNSYEVKTYTEDADFSEVDTTSEESDAGFSLMSATASGKDGNISWELDEKGTLTIDGVGDMPDHSISSEPPEWSSYAKEILTVSIGKEITSIGTNAFRDCVNLSYVYMPDSITSIGMEAFANCTSLNSIEIPAGVTNIDSYAFTGCGSLDINVDKSNEQYCSEDGVVFNQYKTQLVVYAKDKIQPKYTIPKEVTSLAIGAFGTCEYLTDVTLPDGFLFISQGAFYGCTGIKSIVIPSSVQLVSKNTFKGCTNLTDIYYGGDEEQWGKISNEEFSDSVTIHYNSDGSDDTTDDPMLDYITFNSSTGEITGCDTSIKGELVIPSEIDGVTVKSIANGAFNGCTGLTGVTIPASVTKVGDSILMHANAGGYSFPGYSEYGAFEGCTGLKNVTMENGVTKIGDYAFYGCSTLESVTIPENMTNIGNNAFVETGLYNNSNNWENDIFYIGNTLIKAKSDIAFADIKIGTTTVANNAFWGITNLTGVKIPNSITIIGSGAFYGCTGLTSVVVPNSVTLIKGSTSNGLGGRDPLGGYGAFEGCTGLANVVLGEGLSYVESYTFYECSGLTEITIPSSVKVLNPSSFNNCTKLSSIFIPTSVAIIYNDTFKNCSSLDNVYISDLVSYMDISFKNSSLSFSTGSGSAVNSIISPLRNASNLYINGVLATDIVIPDGIKTINNSLSGYSCIENITIPKGVTTIGIRAFEYCDGLKRVLIPDSVTNINYNAFYRCTNLADVTIPDGVTNIGASAFFGCSAFENITIPNSVTSIVGSAFTDTAYYNNSENWENDLLFIDNYLITATDTITSVLVKSDTRAIAVGAFENCVNLENVIISDGITNLSDNLFYGCSSLKNAKIGNDVTTIGSYAFSGCKELTCIEIPVSVTNIGSSVFYNCSNLADIYYSGTEEQWQGIDGYNNISSDVTIHYESTKPAEVIASGDDGNVSWKVEDNGKLIIAHAGGSGSSSSAPWNKYSGMIKDVEIENGVTEIAEEAFAGSKNLETITIAPTVKKINDRAFENCTSLTSVNLPDSVESIGDYAFYNCINITIVILPDGIKSIGEGAFAGCKSITGFTISEDNPYYSTDNGALLNKSKTELIQYPAGNSATTYTVPSTVTSMGKYVFYNCINLTIIILPEGLTSVSDYAFAGCGSLGEISIPNNVTRIGTNAFRDCGSLKTVRISNSVEEIGDGAFYGCRILTNMTIPNGVTRLGECVFYNCINITVITLSDNLTEIGRQTFYNCEKLENITIPNSVTGIDDEAFYGCTSLTVMSIPISVETIGRMTFHGCTALTDIKVDLENSNYASFKGVLFNKDMSRIIKFPEGKDIETYSIPYGVKDADEDFFCGCEPTEISVPKTTRYFSARSVDSCENLESATIYNPEMTIEDGAFTSLPEIFTLMGYENSTAQEYANAHNIKFEAITENDPSEGVVLMDYVEDKIQFAGDIAVAEDGATLLQAVFDENNVLQKFVPYTISDPSKPTTVDGNFEKGKAKFMLWDDFDGMKPFADVMVQ